MNNHKIGTAILPKILIKPEENFLFTFRAIGCDLRSLFRLTLPTE